MGCPAGGAEEMKTIIAGSRFDWADADLRARWRAVVNAAADEFDLSYGITEVFSGVAEGTDHLGMDWASDHGIPIRRFPAQWGLGRQAGAVRNAEMAKAADALVAVWDGKSPGTNLMIRMARKGGLVEIGRASCRERV